MICLPRAVLKPMDETTLVQIGPDENIGSVVVNRTLGCQSYDSRCQDLVKVYNPSFGEELSRGSNKVNKSFQIRLPILSYSLTILPYAASEIGDFSRSLKEVTEDARKDEHEALGKAHYSPAGDLPKQQAALSPAGEPGPQFANLQTLSYPFVDAPTTSEMMNFGDVLVSVWDGIVDKDHCDLPIDGHVEIYPDYWSVVKDDYNKVTKDCADPFVLSDSHDEDHATFIAGVIASSINGKGIAGVYPKSSIWNFPLLEDIKEKAFQFENPIAKFWKDRRSPPDIINLSQKISSTVATNFEAMFDKEQHYQGISLFVVAAGNEGKKAQSADECGEGPACDAGKKSRGNGIISVVALNADGDDILRCENLPAGPLHDSFEPCAAAGGAGEVAATNWGAAYEVAAIGFGASTLVGNRYGEMYGTSVATPYVTGLAALIVGKLRKKLLDRGAGGWVMEPRPVDIRIAVTADPLEKGGDRLVRFGRINFRRALSFDTDNVSFADGSPSFSGEILRETSEVLRVKSALLEEDGDAQEDQSLERIQIGKLLSLHREPGGSDFRVLSLKAPEDQIVIHRHVVFVDGSALRVKGSATAFSLATIQEFTACTFFPQCPVVGMP
ncbi:S8 family peptidase [Mesorhizobium australicum]|uniref:S8 family peptidase n=1 Tax=Mesorhizobium australicum TaxID=536018 RepID=UPI00333522E6